MKTPLGLPTIIAVGFAVMPISVQRAATGPESVAKPSSDAFVYFGSDRAGSNFGFSLAHFDTGKGVLTKPEFLLGARALAFFVIHPGGRHLYTCSNLGAIS